MPSYEPPHGGPPWQSPRALSPSSAIPSGGTFPAPPLSHPEDRRRSPLWRARLVDRARAEFLEMPGMHLSLPQAQRLFGLRRDICQRILDTLVREGFLCTLGRGVYARTDLR